MQYRLKSIICKIILHKYVKYFNDEYMYMFCNSMLISEIKSWHCIGKGTEKK